jgi:hypothetical protein
MDDEEKIYWLKIVMGISCGLLSIVIVPQDLVAQGIRVGLFRLLWLLGTWLGLPIIVVIVLMWVGWIGAGEKKGEQSQQPARDQKPAKPFNLKDALKKIGGIKFILKTGVGAYFFMFLLVSTVFFTIFFPLP